MNIKNFLKENKIWIIGAVFALIVLIAVFIPKDYKSGSIENQIMDEKSLHYKNVLDSIEAKSFYVYDISKGETIFSKDEHARLPLASITKLMSGLVVLDVMPESTIITITKDDIAMEGDNGLLVGEKWKLKDLLDFSLIESSNDGMHAVASALNSVELSSNKNIVTMMNEKAKEFGLSDTVFVNETGLDIDKNMSGAYSSTHDVSMLLEKIIKDNPALISSTVNDSKEFISESNIKHMATNTNISADKIPGLIASKTGFTDLAGGNLAVVFDAGLMHPVAIVVLGSSEEGRFSDVLKLADLALEKLSE